MSPKANAWANGSFKAAKKLPSKSQMRASLNRFDEYQRKSKKFVKLGHCRNRFFR